MNMKLLATAAIAALVCTAGAARGADVLGSDGDFVSYSAYGPLVGVGDTTITNWSTSMPTPAGESIADAIGDGTLTLSTGYTLTGAGMAQVVQGNYGYSANPAYGPTFAEQDQAPYLSVEGGQGPNTFATLATPAGGDNELSIYVGSLDTYNTLTFTYVDGDTETFSGTDLVNALGESSSFSTGDQQAALNNGLLTFDFNSPVTQVVFGSGSINAFEIANISGIPAGGGGINILGGVPEPASWAMMLMGAFGVGAVMRSKRRIRPAVAA